MKAITCRSYGVLRLEEADEPVPGADDVLVDVQAASINAADWHLVRGAPYIARLMTSFTVQPNQRDLALLAHHVERGQVTPVLDRTFALGEASDADRHVEGGHTRGKAVINLNRS